MNHSMGVIYILTNPMYWNIVKIGYTSDITRRLKELSGLTAVPVPYQCYALYEVEAANTDKNVHHLIDKLNPFLRVKSISNGQSREREFYSMTPEDAYDILECIAKISCTEDRLHKTNADGSYVAVSHVQPEPLISTVIQPMDMAECTEIYSCDDYKQIVYKHLIGYTLNGQSVNVSSFVQM